MRSVFTVMEEDVKSRFQRFGRYVVATSKGNKELENTFLTGVTTGMINTVKSCVLRKVDLNVREEGNFGALHILAQKGDVVIGKYLLSLPNIDVNIQTPNGNTPLVMATKFRQRKFGQLLLAHNANPNIKNHVDKIALHYASRHGDLGMVYDLVSNNSLINVYDTFGNTPLSFSVIENANPMIAKFLLKKGANPGLKTQKPQPLFLECALNCRSEEGMRMIEILLRFGVNINTINSHSKVTALHLVSLTGYVPLAEYLLKSGADPDIKDTMGRTAKDLAKLHRQVELLRFYHQWERGDLKETSTSSFGFQRASLDRGRSVSKTRKLVGFTENFESLDEESDEDVSNFEQ